MMIGKNVLFVFFFDVLEWVDVYLEKRTMEINWQSGNFEIEDIRTHIQPTCFKFDPNNTRLI